MFSELRLSQRRLTVSESCKAASASFRVSPSPSRDFLVIFGPSCSALQVNFDLLRGAEGQMELFKQKCPVTGSGVWFLGCLVWDFLSLGQRVCVCGHSSGVFHALQHEVRTLLCPLLAPLQCHSQAQDDGFPLSSTDATFQLQTRHCFNL